MTDYEDTAPAIIERLTAACTKPLLFNAVTDDSVNVPLVFQGGKEPIHLDEYRKTPRKIQEKRTFESIESFTAYVDEFGHNNTAIFGLSSGNFKAIIDYHGKDQTPSWCVHQAVFDPTHTAQWNIWSRADNQRMSQKEFLFFLQDNMTDISAPDGAEILDAVRSVKTSGNKKAISIQDGTEESRDFNESFKVESTLPELIKISIPIYKFGEIFTLKLRPFVHAIGDAQFEFQFKLINAQKTLEHIFSEHQETIAAATGKTVFV